LVLITVSNSNLYLKIDYVRSLEAGRRAAKYVIHRWPKMFPDVTLDPVSL